MSKVNPDGDTVSTLLSVVADLLRGDRHSRRTIAASTGKSLPTADRWIDQLERTLPVRRVREGSTTWIVYEDRRIPSRSAATGACVAASLGALFEGSQQERNLKDARDFLLHERGEVYRDLERKFVLAPRGGESALPEAGESLDEITGALLENRRLRFDYMHNDGKAEELTIEPLSLVIFDHQFYVLAGRDQGKAFYPYRFARMARVQKLEEEFKYPSKGEYDPRSILSQGFGIHTYSGGPVEDIEVLLSGAWANYALTHRWHPSQRATKLEGGQVSVTMQVRLCRELETWILGFGEHAQVIRPERLAEIIAERLKIAATTYPTTRSRPSIAKAKRSTAERPIKRRAR